VGFDSSTQREAPRSIADFLEQHIASLEDPASSPPFRRQPRPAGAFPSPAASHVSDGQLESGAYADSIVNHVMEDICPTFLGISKAKPILSCVVKGTQLPSTKKGATDLNENHPRSIINPQPSATTLDKIDQKTAHGLFHHYLDQVIPQYPIYHRHDVSSAFNSIYYPASNPGQDSPRNRYIISMIMAISLSTAARKNQRAANAHAYSLVRQAMAWMPDVATNDCQGLQAILLLTQYTFLNPSMADLWLLTGLISQAVIDLGLHQELPQDARIKEHQRDMRRRLFWTAWEMEVAVCSIFFRPINLPSRRYDVAFPVDVDDTAITEAGIDLSARRSKFTSIRIWLFRQVEAEIISVMYQNDPIPKEYASLEQWMQKTVTSITDWHTEVHQAAADNKNPSFTSRWTEMQLYSDIATAYILVTLYRPSKRVPHPATDNWVTAFYNAVQVAEGYTKQSYAGDGNIKYVFHPCHHSFNSAIVFLQALSRCKAEISEKFSYPEVEGFMECFSIFFSTIAERWPAATRCAEEYERLLEPIKKEYVEYLVQKANHFSRQTPTLGDAVANGLYSYQTTTDLDDAFNFWTAFNPATTTDAPDTIGAFSYIPHEWNTEFNLNFGIDAIPEV
jgi:hypothetical protein